MTYEQRRTSVTTQRAPSARDRTVETEEVAVVEPSPLIVISRVVALLFGLLQLLIGLRILLLLIDARRTNDLVNGILTVSQWFVGPFEGILRTDVLSSQGSILDVAAIVALIGWTIIELIVLQILRLGRTTTRTDY
jgi:hypothetical protein